MVHYYVNIPYIEIVDKGNALFGSVACIAIDHNLYIYFTDYRQLK